MFDFMTTIKILFWISFCIFLYPYIGYPIILHLLNRATGAAKGRLFPREDESSLDKAWPKVTMLISVYNEEKVIGKKIENTLLLNYPADRLEIIVISDGSTDRTDEIVLQYRERRICLKRYEGRIGKTACLNRTIPDVLGDIIVFSDANSEYPGYVLQHLVNRFEDPSIGFITGYTRYRSADDQGGNGSVGIYARFEKLLKVMESSFGACVGADGAVFAIRKSLYVPLRNEDINDLVIPLNVIRKGFKGVIDGDAYCIEDSAGNIGGEYRRQVRITARTLRALFNNLDLLNPARHKYFSFFLFSHKVSRLAAPLFLVLYVLCNFLLLGAGGIYTVSVAILVAAAGMAAYPPFFGKGSSYPKSFRMVREFLFINAAYLEGWLTFILKKNVTTWNPIRK